MSLADVYFYLLNLNNSISILLIEKVATLFSLREKIPKARWCFYSCAPSSANLIESSKSFGFLAQSEDGEDDGLPGK